MSKYGLEFKIKLVNEYLSGKYSGKNLISQKHGISDSTLKNW